MVGLEVRVRNLSTKVLTHFFRNTPITHLGNYTMAAFFEISGQRIPVPTSMSLVEGVRTLSQQYPMLRHTTVYEEDGRVDGNDIIYPVVLAPVKSKG
jgi:hypothetical protein